MYKCANCSKVLADGQWIEKSYAHAVKLFCGNECASSAKTLMAIELDELAYVTKRNAIYRKLIIAFGVVSVILFTWFIFT